MPENIGDMWYINGTSIKKTSTTVGPFPSDLFAAMIIEAKTRTGWVGWFDIKSGFHDSFLAKMDKLREDRKFSFNFLQADAGENKTFVEKGK